MYYPEHDVDWRLVGLELIMVLKESQVINIVGLHDIVLAVYDTFTLMVGSRTGIN
jgi:hypothetical protein